MIINGNFDKEQVKELSDFLCRWCYENGSPFTQITYSVAGGLKIDNDDYAEYRYEQSKIMDDEIIVDDNGLPIGIASKARKLKGE